MKLTIKSSDFSHEKEKSVYNHNIYRYIGNEANHAFFIEEICHEDFDFCEYWVIDNSRMFLGCSRDYIHENGIVNIDFREYYT